MAKMQVSNVEMLYVASSYAKIGGGIHLGEWCTYICFRSRLDADPDGVDHLYSLLWEGN